MNTLTIIEQQSNLLVDSREVAKMTDVRHADLLSKIKGYIGIMENSAERSFTLGEFFVESTYNDGNSQVRPCYLLTRKGCDMVANKMTGEKGVLFTATYVTEFERMSKSKELPQVEVDMIAAKYAFEILRPSEASRIRMLTKVCNNHNVNTNFLPSYTDEALTRSATDLLEEHGSPMSARTFNGRLVKLGLLEEQQRKGRGATVHRFKAITDAGLVYGKNIVSTQNERETQPHWYPEKFKELLRLAVGA